MVDGMTEWCSEECAGGRVCLALRSYSDGLYHRHELLAVPTTVGECSAFQAL